MSVLVWIVLFSIGFYAQSLILSYNILAGFALYLLVGSLAAWFWYYRDEKKTIEWIGRTASGSNSRFWLIRWIVIAILIILLEGYALYFVSLGAQPGNPRPECFTNALYLWLVLLTLLFSNAAWIFWQDIKSFPLRSLYPLLALILASLAIGMFRLTDVPVTVHGDEGMVGLFARKILNGNISTFFSTSWYAIPQFFFFIPSCGLYLFGDNLWGLRMSTVIMGALCMIPFFLLVRAWWGTRVAFLTALLLIANHWFIHLMHCGVNYVQVSFFTITVLALWAYANARKSIELLLVSGAVLGLSLLSYQANHLLPLLWIASQLWLLILRKISWRWFLASIALPLFIMTLIIAPLLTHDYIKSGKTTMFSSRSNAVVIWSPQNQRHLNGVYRADDDVSVIWREQTKRALLSTVLYPDASVQFHGHAPMLDCVTAIFFMIGIVLACYRFFEPRWSVPVGWMLAILLVGGALTVDAPFYPRLAGACTLLFFPIAGLLSNLLSQTRRNSHIAGLVFSGVFIIAAGFLNLHQYFNIYANQISPKSVHYIQTKMAYAIAERDPEEYIYVFKGSHLAYNSGTVLFLAGNRPGEDLMDIPSNWRSDPFSVFVDSKRDDIIPILKEKLSTFTITQHKSSDGQLLFNSFTRN